MIRKQVYLAPEHDRKLKRMARHRGSTEAEVLRTAVEQLLDPDDDVLAALDRAGLLAPTPRWEDATQNVRREELERAGRQVTEAKGKLGLSDAILEERAAQRW